MRLIETGLPGLALLEPKVFRDERGFFLESYKESDFRSFGIRERFIQDNHSRSKKGALRGLHYQGGAAAQAKLIRVVRGKVWNVAVDLKSRLPGSARWYGLELSEKNGLILYLPPCFANGFLALEDDTELLYKCSAEYAPEAERGIRWNDPDLAIAWPRTPSFVSDKDAALPFLKDMR
ncbi:MAG TPA: dTDP-4-dehydrorhamnose 3,5-epimerase [Spirochaetaceae bacterium]|nr:dTDP-4-dehydrorhamnose 3,5-epimerase [Spirochaetaceae bacterium]